MSQPEKQEQKSSISQEAERAKRSTILASLYGEIPMPAPKKEETRRPKEEANDHGVEVSDEGKLKLFVGGLYFQSEDDLRDYFRKIAPILQCTLKKDKNSSKSRGFAFITLEDKDGSVRRKIFSTKHKIRGKNVDIKLAEADKKKMDQLNANKKVFVGGLDSSVDANYLKKYFEKFGGVQDAIVLRDVNTNQSRGFGFVTFDSEEIADNCVQENNFEIRGKRVDIKKADPKQASQKQSRTYPIPSDDPLFPDPLKIPYPFFPFPGSFDPSLVPNPEMMNPSKLEGMIPPPFPLQFPLPGMPEVPGAGEEGKRPEGERDNHVGPIRDFKGKESTYAPY